MKARPPDRAAAYELFRELEFQALTREFADAAQAVPASVNDARDYRLIRKESELKALVQTLWNAEHIGIAIAEPTEGEDEQRCLLPQEGAFGIAISTAPGKAAYVDLEKFAEGREAAIGPLARSAGEWLAGKIRSRFEARGWFARSAEHHA